MKKLLISTRVTEAQSYSEKRNTLAYDYIEYFEKLGYLVILVPSNSENIQNYVNELNPDLIVLSGGNNICGYDLDDSYIERDNTESLLIKISVEKSIPLLGICRGAQQINNYFNGKLSLDIKNHVAVEHELQSKLNLLDKMNTNSYHNQGMKESDLSESLEALAYSLDGFVEAFKHKENRVLGVQWHPERQNKEFDDELIDILIKEKL